MSVFLFFAFVLGTIVGSFLNVVALRYNTSLPITRGRSKCFSCDKKLNYYELVPLLSFMWLKGKCRGCKSKISWQYPIVEFLTGLLFAGIVFKLWPLAEVVPYYFLASLVYLFAMWGILVVILIYDIRHKIIPDSLVFAFIILGAVKIVFDYFLPSPLTQVSLIDLFAGFILFVPFFLLWIMSRGKWIGLGDGKLALGIGFFLGIAKGVSAITIAFWIGAVVGLLLIFLQKILGVNHRGGLSFISKHITMKTEIPFAPFLILGIALAFFFGFDVFGLGVIMSI